MIAGLDIASTVGVCVGKPGTQTPLIFHERFDKPIKGKRPPHEARFSRMMMLTRLLIVDHGVTFIGIEAPIKLKTDNRNNLQLLYGLIACAQGFAYSQGVETRVIEIGDIDRAFLGAVSKDGRDARKRAIARQCKLLRFDPKTSDEADACAVWWAACGYQRPPAPISSKSAFGHNRKGRS